MPAADCRPFLKHQLKGLPQKLDGWKAQPTAWLNVVKQHWCAYNHIIYPKKPTTIFTNLESLPETRCCQKTGAPQGQHAKTIKLAKGDDKAAWPLGFVQLAIKAAVLEAWRHKHHEAVAVTMALGK